mgnify:CR=1 FL=1
MTAISKPQRFTIKKPSTTAFWRILFLATLGATALNTKKRSTFIQKAQKGEAECFARLGFCYETGYVKIDIQKAIECYAKASDLGVAAAARSLGDLYYFNTPIEDSEIENVKNALKYYERAFYLGDIEVAKKIGFIYLNNEELKDVPKAIEWYEKGLSLGDTLSILTWRMCI